MPNDARSKFLRYSVTVRPSEMISISHNEFFTGRKRRRVTIAKHIRLCTAGAIAAAFFLLNETKQFHFNEYSLLTFDQTNKQTNGQKNVNTKVLINLPPLMVIAMHFSLTIDEIFEFIN